jgi:hypothetical protein
MGWIVRSLWSLRIERKPRSMMRQTSLVREFCVLAFIGVSTIAPAKPLNVIVLLVDDLLGLTL